MQDKSIFNRPCRFLEICNRNLSAKINKQHENNKSFRPPSKSTNYMYLIWLYLRWTTFLFRFVRLLEIFFFIVNPMLQHFNRFTIAFWSHGRNCSFCSQLRLEHHYIHNNNSISWKIKTLKENKHIPLWLYLYVVYEYRALLQMKRSRRFMQVKQHSIKQNTISKNMSI